jgi:AcrR family transcriptional regulator
MTSAHPQRRRLAPQARRADILGAAQRAFAEAPYDRVAVTRIAQDAGVSEALVHRYFRTKTDLYLAVVTHATDALIDAQIAADAELSEGTAWQARIATSINIYLDFVAAAPRGWEAPMHVGGGEPSEAAAVRSAVRGRYVELLRDVLGDVVPTSDYALVGYLGFVDAACLAWVERGLAHADRNAIAAAAIGALQGAIEGG